MTPEQKAAELINKMYYTQSSPTSWMQAKQCALIAVDEIISELAYTQNYVEDAMNKIQVYISYWQEVKQEIEKL